jgi:enamine deaminase RidA (YjgF/YER057c/UK114 family)
VSVVRSRGAMIYVQAAAPDTPQVLAEIEELLGALGVPKANLLTARILLSDREPRAEHDAAWNAWLGALRQPLRVWHLAERKLVDIAVTGLRMRASPSRSPHVQGRPAQG